jgi:hypothetical protein
MVITSITVGLKDNRVRRDQVDPGKLDKDTIDTFSGILENPAHQFQQKVPVLELADVELD